MVRIWLNHWFSTAYNIIAMLRKDEPDFYVIGTNEFPYAGYQVHCDEFYTEPVLDEAAYVRFALDFCKEHAIDVFMPRRRLMAISRHKPEFEALGVKVLIDDYDKVELLNCKTRAYEAFADAGLNVPDYEVVTDAEGFQAAYERLSQKFEKICFKFERDEGGKSYRLIDNVKKGYAALFKKQTTRMSYEDAVAALQEVDHFSPMIVMPYLPDEEISADCLNTANGLIILPRYKGHTRVERIAYDPDILELCERFHRICPLETPYNIQFKYLDGVPYFLEVNTRMSGGIQMACLASGVNIPNIAVNRLLGIEKPWTIDRREKKITHVETPLIIPEDN